MHEHQKTPTCQKKGLYLDTTQKEHYYEKNNKQETQKNMKVQNVNIAPHMLKQMMKLMKSLGLNKMEKYIVDVTNVGLIYAYAKKHIMKTTRIQ